MKICVTGASGLVGKALVAEATKAGHEVVPMVRRREQPGIYWSPSTGEIDAAALEGADAVVNLAGEGIADGRWNAAKKKRILESRTTGATLISETLAKLNNGPMILVNASAIGFYGERGDTEVNEDDPAGDGFLADVCKEWEASTQPAIDAGIRVTKLRIGVVISKQGGALAKMLPIFKLGGGGIVGSGKQYWSWVSIDDVVGSIMHALTNDSVEGPVNAVSPNSVSNAEFTKVMGKVLRRPTIFPLPAFVAKIMLGEMAEALLLASTRVSPKRLQDSGYEFRFADLADALTHELKS